MSVLGNDGPRRAWIRAAGGLAIGVSGAALVERLRRGGRPDDHPEQGRPRQAKAAVTIRRDRDELYTLWRDLESFPTFMAHVEEVRPEGENRWLWKAHGPLGMDVEWHAEITEDVPSERLSWRSVEGSAVDGSGTVQFIPAPGDQGTEVHIELRYDMPGGALGSMIAKLFGEDPQMQLKDDLRRFKQIVETGDVMRSDGAPEGQVSRRQVKQRPAHPLPEKELTDLAGAATGGAS